MPRVHRFPYDTGSMGRRDVWASRERMHPWGIPPLPQGVPRGAPVHVCGVRPCVVVVRDSVIGHAPVNLPVDSSHIYCPEHSYNNVIKISQAIRHTLRYPVFVIKLVVRVTFCHGWCSFSYWQVCKHHWIVSTQVIWWKVTGVELIFFCAFFCVTLFEW